MNQHQKELLQELEKAIAERNLVQLKLAAATGNNKIKRTLIKPILLGGEFNLAFTHQYENRDMHENFSPREALKIIKNKLGTDFRYAKIFSTAADIEFEILPNKKTTFRRSPPSMREVPNLAHDREKKRHVASDAKFLASLGISSPNGKIISAKFDKYRQVDKFIEIFACLCKEGNLFNTIRPKVVDYGSGKNYLTFAMYDYLLRSGLSEFKVVGVELREHLVLDGQQKARDLGFSGLEFRCGTISEHEVKDANAVVALHACDTATDDALVSGIIAGAEIIVVAPCCHKYLRSRLKFQGALKMAFRHGIVEERFAVLLTDSLRALALEACGYSTKVFEFISTEHTDKNTMIVAYKSGSMDRKLAASVLKQTMEEFGLKDFYMDAQLWERGVLEA